MFSRQTFRTALAVVLILLGARWVVNAVPFLSPLRGVI